MDFVGTEIHIYAWTFWVGVTVIIAQMLAIMYGLTVLREMAKSQYELLEDYLAHMREHLTDDQVDPSETEQQIAQIEQEHARHHRADDGTSDTDGGTDGGTDGSAR